MEFLNRPVDVYKLGFYDGDFCENLCEDHDKNCAPCFNPESCNPDGKCTVNRGCDRFWCIEIKKVGDG